MKIFATSDIHGNKALVYLALYSQQHRTSFAEYLQFQVLKHFTNYGK